MARKQKPPPVWPGHARPEPFKINGWQVVPCENGGWCITTCGARHHFPSLDAAVAAAQIWSTDNV